MNIVERDNFGLSILGRFLHYKDCPKRMYLLGSSEILSMDRKVVTIIGSRNLSSYGRLALEKVLSGLAGYGICTVSGLARGCDGFVHEYSIKYRIPTIAIPGSGLGDAVLYPSSNRYLAKEIIKSGGALLSEEEPATRTQTWMFPKRNRLMAQLADLILVVEGHKNSGTQITARLGLEYGRDVAVIPHDIFSNAKEGSNLLLKDGAHLVQSAEDVLDLLGIKHNEQKISIEFNDREQQIVTLIKQGFDTTENLISQSVFPTHEVLEILIWLELRGVVSKQLGKIRVLV